MVAPARGTCEGCGYSFDLKDDGTVPTHDHPKPTRQVCKGAGKPAKVVTRPKGKKP